MNHNKEIKRSSLVWANSGMSLVEVAIVSSIFIVFVSYSGNYVIQSKKLESKASLKKETLLLVNNYRNLLQNNTAWGNTLNENASKTSVLSYFSPRGITNAFYLGYDPENNPSQGFTANGQLCNTYSEDSPDPECPLRLRFAWRDDSLPCSGTLPCQTIVSIEVHLAVSDSSPFRAINAQKLQRTFSRAGSSVAVQPINCNSAVPEVITGFTANGAPICTSAAAVLAQ